MTGASILWGEGEARCFIKIGKKGKIIATRCHILRVKCIKFGSDWGSCPDPADNNNNNNNNNNK